MCPRPGSWQKPAKKPPSGPWVGMKTPRSPRPTTPGTDVLDRARLDASVRLAAAGVLEANALNLSRVLASPALTLGQVIAAGVPQDDFTLDDAVATITHLVLTCLAHVQDGHGLLDGLPELPTDVSSLADCLSLVEREISTWPNALLPVEIDPGTLRSAARIAVEAVTRDLP